MTQVTGTIESIDSRPVEGYGTFYDLIVDGKKYGNGKARPRDVDIGDTVTFEYDAVQKGRYTNNNIRKGTMRRVAAGAGETTAPARDSVGQNQAASTSTYNSPSRRPYEPFDERQEIISKQAALNTALSFGNLAVASGAVLINKSAKDNEKLTLVHNWLLTEAARIYNLTTGRDWDVQLADNIETPKEQAKAASARGRKAVTPARPEGSEDTGSNEWPDEFQDDDIPF